MQVGGEMAAAEIVGEGISMGTQLAELGTPLLDDLVAIRLIWIFVHCQR